MEWQILLLLLLTLLASAIGTLTGFGTSSMMVPVLFFFFPPLETLLFVGIIHFFGDIWKMLLFRSGILWRLLLLFGIPSILLSFIGSSVSLSLPSDLLKQMVGFFLIFYVLFLAANPTVSLPKNPAVALFGGGLSGFLAGLSGIGGAVRGSFLSAFNLNKTTYLFMAGTIAFFTDLTRIINYLAGGTRLSDTLFLTLLLAIPVSFLGAKIAECFVNRIPQSQFRNVIALFLFAIALNYVFFSS